MRQFLLLSFITFCVCANWSCTGSGSENEIKLYPFSANGKLGYFDKTGKILVNPQFKSAELFSEGMALVSSSDAKFGYIDESGKYIINPQYQSATSFREGLAAVVSEGGKCQYIDAKGNSKFVVNDADKVSAFYEGFAVFYKDDKAGYINSSGAVAINPQFDEAYPFCNGMALVGTKQKDNRTSYGYINTKGELVINYQFDIAEYFSEGLAAVSVGKTSGYIDKSGKYIINAQFEDCFSFSNDLAGFKQGDQYGYINKAGKIVINPQFSYAGGFSANGLALVGVGNGDNMKFGYIDKEGRYAINPQFHIAAPFHGSLALAGTSEDKLGLIDSKGTYKVNPQFSVTLVSRYFEPTDGLRFETVSSDESNPKRVAYKWLKGFYQMDYEDVKKFSTDDTKTLLTQLSSFSEMVPDSTKEEMKKALVHIEGVTQEGDSARVTYSVSGLTNKSDKFEPLKLVKKDGKWLVLFTKNDGN